MSFFHQLFFQVVFSSSVLLASVVIKGQIQDLKLGVAQMDCNIWYGKGKCVCVGGGVIIGVFYKYISRTIVRVSVYIPNTISFKYDFYFNIVYLKPPYTLL